MLCRRAGLVADRGANMLEYVGITIVVAGVVVALAVTGLATDVPTSLANGVCRIVTPDDPDCQGESPDGSGTPTPDGSGPPGTSSPGGTGAPSTGPSGTGSDEYQAAQAAAAATKEQQAAEREWGEIDKELLDLVAELVGWNSAKDCFTKGDIGACLETLLTAIPWGKLFKAAKLVPKIWKLFRRFQKLWDRVKTARKNKKAADDALEEAGKACKVNSFVPGTRVLLADGSSRPIEDIRVGDRVLATDPTRGVTQVQPVTALITGYGTKQLVDVVIDRDGRPGGRTSTVTATAGHPFWNPATRTWVAAGDLTRGALLRDDDGRSRTVVALNERTQVRRVHNLTVAGLHTYYVLAGGTSTLVHNAGICPRFGVDRNGNITDFGAAADKVPAGKSIPQGWQPRVADNGKGTVFQRPGATGNADQVRVMEPTPQYPNGYMRIYNKHGQPVDVNGKPGSKAATHIPLPHNGPVWWPS